MRNKLAEQLAKERAIASLKARKADKKRQAGDSPVKQKHDGLSKRPKRDHPKDNA